VALAKTINGNVFIKMTANNIFRQLYDIRIYCILVSNIDDCQINIISKTSIYNRHCITSIVCQILSS
jgi:hypothetical protein